MVNQGLTALPESLDYYNREEMGGVASFNHHYLGVVSAYFYGGLAGIKFNYNSVQIKPCIPASLNCVKATCRGISVEWKKKGKTVVLKIKAPKATCGNLQAPNGYTFKDKTYTKPIKNGTYKLEQIL